MPKSLDVAFGTINAILDTTKSTAESYASRFTADTPREEVMRCYQWSAQSVKMINQAQAEPSLSAYAQEQWGGPTPDFDDLCLAVENAQNDVIAFLETNFPTVVSTLNAAMTSVGMNTAQQDALRNAMGQNLNYLLTHRYAQGGGSIISPNISAQQLSQLVTLLNAVAAAGTF